MPASNQGPAWRLVTGLPRALVGRRTATARRIPGEWEGTLPGSGPFQPRRRPARSTRSARSWPACPGSRSSPGSRWTAGPRAGLGVSARCRPEGHHCDRRHDDPRGGRREARPALPGAAVATWRLVPPPRPAASPLAATGGWTGGRAAACDEMVSGCAAGRRVGCFHAGRRSTVGWPATSPSRRSRYGSAGAAAPGAGPESPPLLTGNAMAAGAATTWREAGGSTSRKGAHLRHAASTRFQQSAQHAAPQLRAVAVGSRAPTRPCPGLVRTARRTGSRDPPSTPRRRGPPADAPLTDDSRAGA